MQLTTCFAPRWRQEDSSGLRNTNRSIPVVLAAGMLLGMAMSVPAEPITPVAAKYSNAYSADRVPTNLFNAAGMDANATYLYNLDGSPGGEPTSANGVSWVTTSWFNVATAAAEGRIWIVIDLGRFVGSRHQPVRRLRAQHGSGHSRRNRRRYSDQCQQCGLQQ